MGRAGGSEVAAAPEVAPAAEVSASAATAPAAPSAAAVPAAEAGRVQWERSLRGVEKAPPSIEPMKSIDITFMPAPPK